MKSIKPGRGPSMMGGVGSIAAAIFGVIWMMVASSIGAPGPFVFFGVIFIIVAIIQAVYHFKNATGENRMSILDITENEADPLDQYFGRTSTAERANRPSTSVQDINFCPNCGENVENEAIRFCPSCGQAVR